MTTEGVLVPPLRPAPESVLPLKEAVESRTNAAQAYRTAAPGCRSRRACLHLPEGDK